MKRNRAARLQRQSEVTDDFDRLLAIAKGSPCPKNLIVLPSRVPNLPNYGGSLPSFQLENNSPSPVDPHTGDKLPLLLAMEEGEKFRLSVPSSPMIQRSHSAGDCSSTYSSGTVTPRTPTKISPSKFFNNVKTLLESCDKKVSCISPPSSPPPVLEIPKCLTAPHSRSNSFKRKRVKDIMKKEAVMNERTTSMPSINKKGIHKRPSQLGLSPLHLQPSYSGDNDDDWERIRNFVTSPKGIINCGDSFRRSTSSLRSLGSWGSGSHCSEDYGAVVTQDGIPFHRVVILGGPGVGKTTLAQQFVTSVCLVNVESVGEFEDCISVKVLLNEEEARVDLLEITYNQDYRHISSVDAYIIVYASTDRSSFHHAVDLLYQLCKEDVVQKPVILVANKSDLVRAREIAEQEGKSAAVTYNCKYFEVSSLMNLKVDELLAGILNQIRLHSMTTSSTGPSGRRQVIPRTPEPLARSPFPLVGKIFNRQRGLLRRQGSKSCDNLLVI